MTGSEDKSAASKSEDTAQTEVSELKSEEVASTKSEADLQPTAEAAKEPEKSSDQPTVEPTADESAKNSDAETTEEPTTAAATSRKRSRSSSPVPESESTEQVKEESTASKRVRSDSVTEKKVESKDTAEAGEAAAPTESAKDSATDESAGDESKKESEVVEAKSEEKDTTPAVAADTKENEDSKEINSKNRSGLAASASKPFSFYSSSSGASAFGGAPVKPASSLAFGSSIFGSKSSDSSAPKPFSSFTSSNPFLSAFSGTPKQKKTEEDKEDAKDENSENPETDDMTGDFEPYVQLKLEEKKIETGEEMETSIFSCRAKLYALDPTKTAEGWKERGVGVLHLNVKKNAEPEPEPEAATDSSEPTSKELTPASRARQSKARIVMRSDGVLRVILNLPIYKGIEVMPGMKSSMASEKFIRISAFENSLPMQYALKMGQEATAKELFEHIKKQMSS